MHISTIFLRRTSALFLLVLAIFWAAPEARVVAAGKITHICLADEATLREDRDGAVRGLFADMFQEMATRAGREVVMLRQPWKRCQLTAMETDGYALGPLTRTSRREGHYGWVAPLFPLKVVYMSVKGENKAPKQLEDVRRLKIGIKGGTVSEFIARKHGIDEANRFVGTSQDQLLKMLAHGRLDAWLIWDLIAYRVLQQQVSEEILGDRELETGYEENVGLLWFAVSRAVDESEKKVWRDALKSMRDDGTFDQILKNYLGDAFIKSLNRKGSS